MKLSKTLKLVLAAISAIALISTAEAASFSVTVGATTLPLSIPPDMQSGSIGDFQFNLVGVVNTDSVNPALDLAGTVNFTGAGPATITLCIMGDGFTPLSGLLGSVGGSFGGPSLQNPNLSATIFQTLMVNGVPPANSNTVTLNGAGGFHSGNVSITPLASPFSLEDCVTITFNGPGFVSFDAGIFRTPGVPDSGATVALLGLGLLSIAGVAKLRGVKIAA